MWGFQQKRLRDDRGKVFGPRQLIPDLSGLEWRGKTVTLVFDSDVADRPDLQMAEHRLAELLTSKGAQVRVARMPQIGDGKAGLDDFLVHHGDAGQGELQRLIDAAQEAAKPTISGPMDIAKLLMQESLTGATGIVLRYWREDFWRFTRRCYLQVSDVELEACVLQWLDRHGFQATPRSAADILMLGTRRAG